MIVDKMTPHWAVGPSEGLLCDYIAICPSEDVASQLADLLNGDPDWGCTYAVSPILVAVNDAEVDETEPTKPDYPEPPPVNAGQEVTPVLLDWLRSFRGRRRNAEVVRCAISLVESRAAFGLQKYGQPLRTEDGRDVIHDALQELGDLMQYVMSARMQGCDIAPIRRLLPILRALLEDE